MLDPDQAGNVDAVMDKVDTDGSGDVDRPEFERWLLAGLGRNVTL